MIAPWRTVGPIEGVAALSQRLEQGVERRPVDHPGLWLGRHVADRLRQRGRRGDP